MIKHAQRPKNICDPKIDTTAMPYVQSSAMNYSTKTREELIALCKNKCIKGYSGKKKDDLIKLLTPVPVSEILITPSIDTKGSAYGQNTLESLLQQIILEKEIETVELYKELYNINKSDHSNGVYYTHPDFFKDLLKNLNLCDIHKTTTLDFCCGTGNLFIGYLDFLKTKYSDVIVRNIILNSVFIDIDSKAMTVFKLKLYCWIKNNLSANIAVKDYINNFYINDGLLDISLFKTKINIILSNPPFINLKTNVEYKKKLKALKYYKYSVNGMMDTYIVSIERIINLLENDGRAIIICPSQILTNISCLNLRKHIIDTLSINNVFKFSEKNSIFPNVSQSICVLDITNNTHNTNMRYNTCEYNGTIVVNSSNAIDKNVAKRNDYNIIPMTNLDSEFLGKITAFPTIEHYKMHMKCGRGNIDVTLDKEHISTHKSSHPLVRGRNIQSLDTITEYISSKTVQDKKIDVLNKKLVCQQICNMNSQNRLSFTILDSTFVISNSCNYIRVNDEKYISTLKHILNSNVLNRYFNIFSGNNHISINEINNFPLPNIFDSDIDLENISPEECELKIYELYNLDHDFIQKYFRVSKKQITIYNHISQKLSNLELSMAGHIKPGGNWKDIPLTITSSARLTNIRKTGGRTTLYGRLDYSKPGFTITTQFSRLPNSSNLHPTKNRMITIREAGLIQSFPLDFKFNNNNSSAIKQIGKLTRLA